MSSCGNDGDSRQKLQQSDLADERWKMVRSAIEHEDNLINQRLSWLFAGHAFLFICFAMLQTSLLTKDVELEPALLMEMGIAVVLLCAAFIALITHRSVAFAYIHSNALRKWWIDNYNPNEWHYKDRSVISSFLHFFTCGQRPEDFRQVEDLTQQEVGSADPAISPGAAAATPEKPAANYPPIKGHFPKRTGSIPALMAVMDLALIAVCLGVGGQKFLDGQVTSVRSLESRSSSAGNPGAGLGNQQMFNEDDPSQGGAGGGADEGGGGVRSTGALDIP